MIAEAGLFAIPGIGQVVAAGPLAATIIGLVGGGIVGSLVGGGIPEEHAKEYEQYLKRRLYSCFVEAEGNENKVYQAFADNQTENVHMYPDGAVEKR